MKSAAKHKLMPTESAIRARSSALLRNQALLAGLLLVIATVPISMATAASSASSLNFSSAKEAAAVVTSPGFVSVCPKVPNATKCSADRSGLAVAGTQSSEAVLDFYGLTDRQVQLFNYSASGSVTVSVVGYFDGAASSPAFHFASTRVAQATTVVTPGQSASLPLSGLPSWVDHILVDVTSSLSVNNSNSASVQSVLTPGDSTGRLAAARRALSTVTNAPQRAALLAAITVVAPAQSVSTPTPTPSAPAPLSTPTPSPTTPAPPAPVAPPIITHITPTSGPNASNTGVPAGTPLTTVDGDLTLSTPGQVVSGLLVKGFITIRAANVTIKDSIVEGRPTSVNAALISNMSNYPNLVVEDSELFAAYPSVWIKGIVASNVTVLRDNIHDVTDNVHIVGSNVTVQNSWLHGNLHYAVDPNNGNGPTHDDNIQIQAGTNFRFVGNRLEGAHNSVVQVTQDSGAVSNILFSNNYADGGNCSVNILEKSYGPVHGVVISNNVFGSDTAFKDCAVGTVATTAPLITATNDHFVNGTDIDVRVFCADMLHLCQAIPAN